MNRIEAVVTAIERCERVSEVTFDAQGVRMKMVALELSESVRAGQRVVLGVKAANVALCKGCGEGLSISNRLSCRVASVHSGDLLSKVMLEFGDGAIESIVTRASAEALGLVEGDEITALIKASELSILEVNNAATERP